MYSSHICKNFLVPYDLVLFTSPLCVSISHILRNSTEDLNKRREALSTYKNVEVTTISFISPLHSEKEAN